MPISFSFTRRSRNNASAKNEVSAVTIAQNKMTKHADDIEVMLRDRIEAEEDLMKHVKQVNNDSSERLKRFKTIKHTLKLDHRAFKRDLAYARHVSKNNGDVTDIVDPEDPLSRQAGGNVGNNPPAVPAVPAAVNPNPAGSNVQQPEPVARGNAVPAEPVPNPIGGNGGPGEPGNVIDLASAPVGGVANGRVGRNIDEEAAEDNAGGQTPTYVERMRERFANQDWELTATFGALCAAAASMAVTQRILP